MRTRFVGADRVRNAHLEALKSDLDALRIVDGESLDQYAGRMKSMSVKHSYVGGTLENEAMVKKLFDTVSDRFLHVIPPRHFRKFSPLVCHFTKVDIYA